MVSRSQWASRKSRIVATISSGSSPRPTISPGLGTHGGVDVLDPPQQLQRPLVFGLRPDHIVEPRDAFHVVVQDVRASFHHLGQRLPIALEIGDQHLDAASRHPLSHAANDGGENVAAAVRQIIPVHRRHHRVAQPQRGDGLDHALRFLLVHDARPSGAHGAKAATSCAGVAQQHEGGASLLPAFADVGTHGLLAHGVQAVLANQAFDFRIRLAGG